MRAQESDDEFEEEKRDQKGEEGSDESGSESDEDEDLSKIKAEGDEPCKLVRSPRRPISLIQFSDSRRAHRSRNDQGQDCSAVRTRNARLLRVAHALQPESTSARASRID